MRRQAKQEQGLSKCPAWESGLEPECQPGSLSLVLVAAVSSHQRGLMGKQKPEPQVGSRATISADEGDKSELSWEEDLGFLVWLPFWLWGVRMSPVGGVTGRRKGV